MTTKLFAYDATEVAPWPLLLMADEEPVFEQIETTSHVIVKGWARFRCSTPSIMKVITGVRSAWQRVLSKKLGDPQWDQTTSRELTVIKRLILDQGLGFELAR